jgi:hypothetical protein
MCVPDDVFRNDELAAAFCSDWFGHLENLIKAELPEGNTEWLVGQSGFYELKSITKSGALAHQCMNLDRHEIYSKFEPNHYAEMNFIEQHCRNSGRADVYRVPADNVAIARINTNRDFQFEAGLIAILDKNLRLRNSG